MTLGDVGGLIWHDKAPPPICVQAAGNSRRQAGRDKGDAMTRIVWAALAVMLPLGAMAEVPVPLPQEAHINEQLIAGAEGDLIRKNCPAISARMLVVLDKLFALKSYAEAKGYTEAEVKAFLKDPDQKARVKGAAAEYLATQGAVAGDGESYCTVGRAEIAKGTLVGSLLQR